MPQRGARRLGRLGRLGPKVLALPLLLCARGSADGDGGGDPARRAVVEEMIYVPGGAYHVGTARPLDGGADGEGPERLVRLDGFAIGVYEASNAQFLEFEELTGYRSEAEAVFGWSFVFQDALPPELRDRQDQRAVEAPWWMAVEGASWLRPAGRGSACELDHPVVHVTWADAMAFCAWRYGAAARLPTEAEWETAARAGRRGRSFPWGEREADGSGRMNVWQGSFPGDHRSEDGFELAAPVRSMLPQNEWGMHHVVGNVWEWTLDAWDGDGGGDGGAAPQRTKKGGSFLCHRAHCFRYRVPARARNTADSSSMNTGFRCAVPEAGIDGRLRDALERATEERIAAAAPHFDGRACSAAPGSPSGARGGGAGE